MFRKTMAEISIYANEHDEVVLEQSNAGDDSFLVQIPFDQVAIVAQWMLDAAGRSEAAVQPARSVKEIREQARIIDRVDEFACEEAANDGALRGLSFALHWAAGDAEESPDEWIQSNVRKA